MYRKYGVTRKDYDTMLVAQAGVCAICGKAENGKRLAIDHCHKTGEVRGLLCALCNTAIGKLNDDPELLERAAMYLRGKLYDKSDAADT